MKLNVVFMRRLLGLACLVSAAVATPASAYSGLVVFGDSLSDNGNAAALVGVDATQVISSNSYIPSQPYASARFSNAGVWVDSFAAGLGLAATPAAFGGTNFAVGGSRTSLGGTSVAFTTMLWQVETALGVVGGVAPSDFLYVLAGGGNNARDALEAISLGADATATIAGAAAQYATDLSSMVGSLKAAGAQDIVVWNTPNIGFAPAVLASGVVASQLGQLVSSSMNGALSSALAGQAGVKIFDVFGLLGDITADPGAFGLTNVADACGVLADACTPSTYLFYDGIHPTSGGHALLANAMIAAVVPEPAAAWMFAGGLVLIWARRRRSLR